jgi:diguanylate cyclase
MKTNDDILKIISNETKDSIEQLSIVTPSIFASIFSKFANDHDAIIEDEFELAQDLLKMECTQLTQMQSQASQSANKLTESTNKAIDAIQAKDDALLGEVLHEVENLRKEVEKLKESVYKDELTHTYNRKWLHDNYISGEEEIFQDRGVLAILDINYFKIINDTYGHIIGDKVLIFLANIFKKTSYPVVRYGGDEFCIVFPKEYTQESAIKVLHDLRESTISKKLKALDSTFSVSFSYGAASFSESDRLPQIIEEADKNMYADKIEIKKRITGI